MRVSALIQLSALAACPLALLTLNSSGDSRVPAQPNSTPQPPETASSDSQSAEVILPTPVAPEAFSAEALGISEPTVRMAALSPTADAQTTQTPPNLPNPTLYSMQQSAQVAMPRPQAAPRLTAQSSTSSTTASPEPINFSWDRLVARSVGLDEETFAAASRGATSPEVTPAPPSQELPSESASLDPQPAIATPDAQAAAEPIAQTVTQPVTPPVIQTAAQPVAEPIELSEAPAETPAETPVETLAETPAETQPAIQTISQTDVQPEEPNLPVPPADRSSELTPAAPSDGVTIVAAAAPAAPADTAPSAPISQPQTIDPPPPLPASPPALQSPNPPAPQPPRPSAPQPAPNPIPTSAVDQSYRLGAGDAIQITFFNVPEYSGPQRVLVDGSVNLPAVGSVPVAGLTLREAEQAIANVFGRELRNIRVTVSLAQARPLRVGVAGEVRQPGYYVMASNDAQLPGIAQAIQTAGGVTQLADLRQVQVRRVGRNGTPETFMVNLWALLEQGDLSQNLTLRDGDTIVIAPTASMNAAETEQLAASNLASNQAQAVNISLVGAVARPGAYKLDSAAGNRATLTQAIQAAGGVTPEADLRKVEVQRTARNGTVQTATLDLWQLVSTGDLSQDLILQPGDRITVAKAEAMTPEEMARVTGSNVSPAAIRVNIVGETTSPGAVEVPANTTLNQALLAAGGLNRRARSTVQLVRINPNGTLTQRSIDVDLERPIDSETNPILFNNDVIIVRRNGLATVTDGANDILAPFFRILPIFGLF